MGNYSSSANEKTQLQKDIAYLGDRMPFGDDELLQVYRVYQKLQEKHRGGISGDDGAGGDVAASGAVHLPSSFLKDAAVLSFSESLRKPKKQASPAPDGDADRDAAALLEERLYLLEAVERKILPPGFGNRLYRTSFLGPLESSVYDDDDEETKRTNARSPPGEDDEYTRTAKLEKFFEGFSNGTRRDRRTVTSCLIGCCTRHPPPEAEETEAPGGSPFGAGDFAYGGGGAYSNGDGESKSKQIFYDPMELVDLGYRLCLAAAFLKEATGGEAGGGNDDDDRDLGRFLPPGDPGSDDPAPGLKALANSLASLATRRKQRRIRSTKPSTALAELVGEDDVFEWVEQVAPMYGSILPTFLHCVFFPNKAAPPTRSTFDYPRISQESTVFSTNSSPLLFSFGCMSPALGGEFYRLYTSASDGLSFNRLQNALLGYGGPTLLIIQSGRSTFGAFTASPWKESKDFYGNHDCFLYKLLPETTAVYRPTGGTTKANSRFMYCNSFARSRGYDQQAHGIGFGGSTDRPRLFLSESFDDCRAGSDDLTFEKGPLLAGRQNGGGFSAAADAMFEIDNLEVWGVGGTEVVRESLEARSRSRDIRQANINKARKVDKAAFLDDLRSGIIENKAFAHREQIQGRDGSVELLGDENN
mmetsp:Transcript_30861/g.64742  ORF Transcript_30861/g.64742 Transcript_30861/m.64742 type:complete len:644 (-) Transcript_30861:1119-3050(-)|eukprot:CAMPEP_0201189456 /NCGR_PEP_ID=MMETSP0851-20130426/137852_1 /ASSEMBLY_ACC=CAM_ASM_000631 /TAXON_ID=183588 /ORGANISM="Pseudo-nitzschia fraudulenta, Strain WWA7" /LENGTH=643 /DNA_ID=CAMNT_0047475279 /DNA_START=318 /DNA_END=2249 /DNA_ORIENTATION=-